MPSVNPVAGTNKTGSKSRDRLLQDSEIAAIWNALGDDDYGASPAADLDRRKAR